MTLSNKKRALTPVILGLLFLVSAAQAEYVCEVTIMDNLNGSTYGEHGFVLARYYTERNCGGSFVTQQWYCTANATASGCAASTRYHYSEPALLSLYEKLTDAAFWGRQVRFTRVGCMSGSSDCGGPVYMTSQY
jgi:hypothetical protein